jgi:hypothetical protein
MWIRGVMALGWEKGLTKQMAAGWSASLLRGGRFVSDRATELSESTECGLRES